MQVEDGTIPATIDKIIDAAEAMGGYLTNRTDTSVQIRVPSQRFREALGKIEGLGEVLGRSVKADDVSEQYTDLENRLINLKATQRRLQEFLARAGTVPDMLSIGRELERVAGEIEQIEGKLRYFRARAAFSLISVAIQAKPKPVNKVVETPPPPPPPRDVDLPVNWIHKLGLPRLLDLKSK